jgi:hypothetical protein
MPDWHQYLTPAERGDLLVINQQIAIWQADRRKLMNRAKQRKHRANRDGKASL